MFVMKIYDTFHRRYVPLFSMEFNSLKEMIDYSNKEYGHLLEYYSERVHFLHNDILIAIGGLDSNGEFHVKVF